MIRDEEYYLIIPPPPIREDDEENEKELILGFPRDGDFYYETNELRWKEWLVEQSAYRRIIVRKKYIL